MMMMMMMIDERIGNHDLYFEVLIVKRMNDLIRIEMLRYKINYSKNKLTIYE